MIKEAISWISYELYQNLSKICNESQNFNLLQSQTRFYGSACGASAGFLFDPGQQTLIPVRALPHNIVLPPKLTCYLEIPYLPFCLVRVNSIWQTCVFLGNVLNESIYFVVDQLVIFNLMSASSLINSHYIKKLVKHCWMTGGRASRQRRQLPWWQPQTEQGNLYEA